MHSKFHDSRWPLEYTPNVTRKSFINFVSYPRGSEWMEWMQREVVLGNDGDDRIL